MDIDFAAILQDEGTYPDALEVTLGDKKVSLGQIRDRSKREQARIAAELAKVNEERQSLDTRNKEILALSEKATEVYNRLQEQLAKASERTPAAGDPEALWGTDPWYQPARKRVEEVDKMVKQLSDTQRQIAQAVQGAIALYMDDRFDREYEQVAPEIEKFPKLAEWKDQEKLKKFAADNNLLDKRKLPSIRAAVEKLTAAEREAMKEQTAYERGLNEGMLRARLGAQPKPASAAAAVVNASGKPAETFDEAMDPAAVAEDSELNTMLASLGVALGPQ